MADYKPSEVFSVGRHERGIIIVITEVVVFLREDPVAPSNQDVAIELGRHHDVVDDLVLGQILAEVPADALSIQPGWQEAVALRVHEERVGQAYWRDATVDERSVGGSRNHRRTDRHCDATGTQELQELLARQVHGTASPSWKSRSVESAMLA
jgi:hypothetical protein